MPPVLDLLRGRLDYLAELIDADAANARATVDESGIGGQTALFHAVTQFGDCGLLAAQLLMDHGAYLSVRVRLPRHYERPGEIVECTPLGQDGGKVARARGCGVTRIVSEGCVEDGRPN
ncbi:MAG: hypothetical protein AUF67_01520 [Acidobacteria bacterium 13_1_20CM_58_21]|nr:MAG: hypothetical protein AUF67_01520 [Acidobacteria bacterium 13_1_20CM_58_21]